MPINRSVKPLPSQRRRCAPVIVDRSSHLPDVPLLELKDPSRAALMERARLLVADADYPPAYVIDAVADLMARHVRV